MKKIVLDVETKNTFQDVGSREPAALDLSLAVIYDYERDAYEGFWEADLPRLWPLLEAADLLIGYNLKHFDLPILNKYYGGDLNRLPVLDILEEIKKASGKRVALDLVAAGTLGRGKLGHGLQAVTWWREGQLDKILEYCREDVRLTKELYDYARAHNHLKYKVFDEIKALPLDATSWERQAPGSINYTLPF
jgi:DEAD/DEAH box helicase domain-containing protein